MPVSLKTQVNRTAKTPVTARRARVGGLCGFRGAAERVYQPEARRPDVAPLYGIVAGTANAEKTAAGEFWQRKKPQAAKQDKAAGSCAPRGGHICPRCGQFWGFARGLLRGQKKHSWGRDLKKARRFKENSGVARKKCVEIEQIAAGAEVGEEL